MTAPTRCRTRKLRVAAAGRLRQGSLGDPKEVSHDGLVPERQGRLLRDVPLRHGEEHMRLRLPQHAVSLVAIREYESRFAGGKIMPVCRRREELRVDGPTAPERRCRVWQQQCQAGQSEQPARPRTTPRLSQPQAHDQRDDEEHEDGHANGAEPIEPRYTGRRQPGQRDRGAVCHVRLRRIRYVKKWPSDATTMTMRMPRSNLA
jgi:hypothetical protein